MIRSIIFIALLLATFGCSSRKNPPLVSNLQVQANPQAPHVVKDRDFPQPVVAELTFSKRAFANQEWLYGVSIQKARFANGGEDSEMPAINFSWRPTQFQVVNSQLQLLEDRTHLAESDINFPSRLLHSLPVVRNEGDQLTVRIEQASPVLQVFMMGNDAPAPRASWVRSAKFVAESNLLMMETSVEFADGSLAEFLEVLYPRSAFVPKDAHRFSPPPIWRIWPADFDSSGPLRSGGTSKERAAFRRKPPSVFTSTRTPRSRSSGGFPATSTNATCRISATA